MRMVALLSYIEGGQLLMLEPTILHTEVLRNVLSYLPETQECAQFILERATRENAEREREREERAAREKAEREREERAAREKAEREKAEREREERAAREKAEREREERAEREKAEREKAERERKRQAELAREHKRRILQLFQGKEYAFSIEYALSSLPDDATTITRLEFLTSVNSVILTLGLKCSYTSLFIF